MEIYVVQSSADVSKMKNSFISFLLFYTISCSANITGIRIDPKGKSHNISKDSLKSYFHENGKDFSEYKNKYKFTPEYEYGIAIYNFGYTSKEFVINLDEHCPPAFQRFLIIKRDFSDLFFSFISLYLYNNTNFLVFCQEKLSSE